jgi:hypothetical protein
MLLINNHNENMSNLIIESIGQINYPSEIPKFRSLPTEFLDLPSSEIKAAILKTMEYELGQWKRTLSPAAVNEIDTIGTTAERWANFETYGPSYLPINRNN